MPFGCFRYAWADAPPHSTHEPFVRLAIRPRYSLFFEPPRNATRKRIVTVAGVLYCLGSPQGARTKGDRDDVAARKPRTCCDFRSCRHAQARGHEPRGPVHATSHEVALPGSELAKRLTPSRFPPPPSHLGRGGFLRLRGRWRSSAGCPGVRGGVVPEVLRMASGGGRNSCDIRLGSGFQSRLSRV